MMKYLCSLRITTRFMLLSLPVIIVVTAVQLAELELFKKHTYDLIEREMETLTLVAASSIGTSGDRDEMIKIVKRLRHANGNYFFVINKNLVFEHHISKTLEGTKINNKDLAAVARNAFMSPYKHASGVYVWDGERKLSSIRVIPELGIAIGTGLTLTEEEDRLWEQQVIVMFIILGLIGVTVLGTYVMRKSLDPALRNITTLAHNLSNKDLSDQLEVFGKDEFAEAFTVLQSGAADLRASIISVSERANATSDLGDDLASKMDAVMGLSQQQTDELTQVATGMQEMSATIQEVSATIENAVGDVSGVKAGVEEAGNQTNNTVIAVDGLIGVNNEWAGRTKELVACSDKMSGIVDGIVAIADQTNLLALNAAIEAARAGDVGRGFAVVADEVRNLSTKTTEQVEFIRDLIEQLSGLANSCGVFAESSQDELDKVRVNSISSNERLGQVLESVTVISENMTQIAVAAEEQSVTTEQVNQNINTIESLSRGLLADVEESAKYSQLTKAKSGELQTLVSSYKL